MSEREQAKQIIDTLPDYKMQAILMFLRGVEFDDELEDDRFCEELVEKYENDPDKGQFTIIVDKPAKKFIDKLPKPDRARIADALEKLPDNGDIKELKGHKGWFRLRVGAYRIIYTVDNGRLIIRIIDAGNRGQIYNRY